MKLRLKLSNSEEMCKEYYVGRGTGDGLKSVAENGNTVTVTDLKATSSSLHAQVRTP